jgi:mono/diheme cytochrome c family protein
MPMPAARSSGSSTRRLVAFALLALGAALPAAALVPLGVASGSKAFATAPKTVTVTLRDTAIALSPKTAPAGKVQFAIKNAGKKPHNFRIAGKTSRTLTAGKSTKLLVTFTKAGKYAYSSTVKGDTRLKGTLKVTAAPATTAGDAKAGRSVFVANCGTCHALKAAGTRGTIGPNLDTAPPMTFAAIVKIVTNGKTGTAMAPFKSTLTSKQIDDVAAFIYASTH